MALVVIGIGAAAVIEAVRFAHGMSRKAAYIQAASAEVQNEIEWRKAASFALIPGTTVTSPIPGLPDTSTLTVTVTPVPGRPRLWWVRARADWTAGGRLGSLSGGIEQETLVYAP